MATMLDTWDSDFAGRINPHADPHDLLTELQPVLAAKPKWAALAAGLAATAAAAAKLSSITDFPTLIQQSGPMFADGAKAADECAKLPAAAMTDGITRMGVDPNISDEVRPGTYMTDGGTGPDCHWAKLRSNDPNDIVQKGQGKGVQTVVIDSPYFQSDRCGVWWMVGYPRP